MKIGREWSLCCLVLATFIAFCALCYGDTSVTAGDSFKLRRPVSADRISSSILKDPTKDVLDLLTQEELTEWLKPNPPHLAEALTLTHVCVCVCVCV